MPTVKGDNVKAVSIIETPDSDYHDYLLTIRTPKGFTEIAEVDQEAYDRFCNVIDDKYLDDE